MPEEPRDLDALWTDEQLTQALERGYRRAVERHRRLGQSMVSWENGKVVVVPPEDLPRYRPDASA